VTRTGSRLAVDSDVTEGSEYAFALTEQAIKAGAVTVEWQSHGYENSRLHGFLRHSIYRDLDAGRSSETAAIWRVQRFSCLPNGSHPQGRGERAAKWISDAIGEVEIERLRESRSTGRYPQGRNSKSYNLERQVEPLVMASETTGLQPLHGYMKTGNLVVPMSFPYIQLSDKHPKFIERTMWFTQKNVPAAVRYASVGFHETASLPAAR